MKMTRGEVRVFFAKLEATLNSEAELGFDIIYALNKTKNKVKPIAEEANEMLISLQKAERQLAVKFCERDKDDKPIIRDDKYIGLETGRNTEYDEKIEDLIDKRVKYFKEEVEISIHHIERKIVPKKEKASILELLCHFIEENNEPEG